MAQCGFYSSGTIKRVLKTMGNSPVDKSKDFIKSGMTLVTETASDKHLKPKKKEPKKAP
jgi:hypothetical protein